jgi:hypothetical protein
MDVLGYTITAIIVVCLFLGPLIISAHYFKVNIWKHMSLKQFIPVANVSTLVYIVIVFFMFIALAGMDQKLIEDPQYLSPSDNIITASVIILFSLLVICVCLPSVIIMNCILLVNKKLNKNANLRPE